MVFAITRARNPIPVLKSNRNHLSCRILILCVLFLVCSCAPMAEISVKVMDPAKVTLPEDVSSIALLNRSIQPRFLSKDTSLWKEDQVIRIDSLVCLEVFRGLKEALNKSPLFSLGYIPVEEAWRTDISRRSLPLSPEQLHKVPGISDADAVISLEWYSMSDSFNIEKKYIQLDRVFEGYWRIYLTGLWRIYGTHSDTIYDEFVLQDTIDWVFGMSSLKLTKMQAVGIEGMHIKGAARSLGYKYGQRISPAWTETSRYFYLSGGRGMRKASRLALRNEWLKAAEIWRKMSSHKDSTLAARACFNMALACETQDMLVPALDWVTKSYVFEQAPLTSEYITLLQTRTIDMKKLKLQIPAEK